MKSKPTLSDLLDIRDGEFADAQQAAHMLEDADARATLASLTGLKAGLRALPGIEPDPAVWEAIERRRRKAWLRRFPLATAATVFLAAALTVAWWNPAGVGEGDAAPRLAAPAVSDPVAELLLRSQRLESALLQPATLTDSSASERALLYAIADVDAQLSALYESASGSAGIDPETRERLWRQRVMLLESLADERRGRAMLRPAIY